MKKKRLWFPYKLLFKNFRAHTEFESDIFKTARLSFSFRLMKSLCSLSLLSAASFIESPLQQFPQPSSMYDFDQMKKWLNILNSLPVEKCPVKESLEDDNDEDNEYFSQSFFCHLLHDDLQRKHSALQNGRVSKRPGCPRLFFQAFH